MLLCPRVNLIFNQVLKMLKIPINNLAKGIINIILGTKKLSQNYITHRDIKPLNILYHNDTLKIIDFGLAGEKSKAEHFR